MKRSPKSQLLLSVCKNLNSECNYIAHINVSSVYDIDWIIEKLQIEKERILKNLLEDN